MAPHIYLSDCVSFTVNLELLKKKTVDFPEMRTKGHPAVSID